MKRFPTVVATVLTLLFMGIGLRADAKPGGVGDDDIVRFTRTLSQVAGKRGVSIWLHRRPTESGWNLRLFDRTRSETVGLTSLPEWAGADYYSYDVIVRGFGNVVVLLFEATPTPGVDAPPGADSFQLAWAYGVKRDEREAVWRQIASTRSSPLDGGDRLVLREEGGKERLVRLRTSDETRFCGRHLAAYQLFNPEEMSFRSEVDLDALERNAVELKSEVPDWQYVPSAFPRFGLWYSATSDRYNEDDSRTVIRPLELGDRNPGTAWMEGAPGLGRGEFVTARINDALKLRAVRVLPGHLASADTYRDFGSPTRVLVSVEDGSAFAADIPQLSYDELVQKGGVMISLPRPVSTSCVSVVVLDGRGGAEPEEPESAWKQNAVAISEITPITELYGLAPDVAALVVVEKLLKEADTRSSRRLVQLTSPLADQLVQILESVLQGGSPADRVRVIPLLRSLPSDASVPILVDMFRQAEPSEEAYTLVKPAISAHGERAAGPLVELLDELSVDEERKYTDVTRLVGRLGRAEHLNALLRRLGQGSRHVRNERVRAISRGGETMLAALFAVAQERVDEPAGQDALLAINSIGRKLYFRGQGEQDGSGVLIEVLGKGKKRRTRLLALRGLGFFATDGGIEALTNYVEVYRDPLLRREAVEALARYPSREARSVLEAALFDESPDVRIAAISGLSERKDRRQALASIQRYVERESWTPGLEVAYTIMAEFGDDNLLGQMESVIASDPTSDRAALAADALERAGRSVSPSLASKLIFSPSTDIRMKRSLVDLLGLEESKQGEEVLIELIRSPKPFEDLERRPNERLRQRAVLALGRRDTDSGRRELLRIVREGESSDFKAIALRGLAFSHERGIVPELELLRADAGSDLEGEFERTIDMVERRAGIEELQEGIEEAVEPSGNERDPSRATKGRK